MRRKYVLIFRRKLVHKIVFILGIVILALTILNNHRIIGLVKPIFMMSDDLEEKKTDAKLAIIIDDFGSSRDGVKEMMSIDRHLTFAVIPFLDYSEKDAVAAYEKGYEVIAHLPLEPVKGKRSWLGPMPILSGMEYDKVRGIVKESIDNIPYARGANIHMGSKASSEEIIMTAILDEIKERNLYFVDSLTASKPVSKKIAQNIGVVCFNRDVFLDGQQPKSFVKERLRKAGDIALKCGAAVAIGHVGIEGGRVTAQAITEMLPEFDEKNIRLVFISELTEAN